jgi:hypothetical protein
MFGPIPFIPNHDDRTKLQFFFAGMSLYSMYGQCTEVV